ncbi:MAG: transporter, partial [Acidobacteriota bacterium]
KRRRWFAELDGGAWFFTTNSDFFRGGTRQQNPIWSVQFHLIRILRRRAWIAFDSNGYFGGRTTTNGTVQLNFQENSRLGGTLAYRQSRHQVLKVSVNAGAYTTIGEDFTSVGIVYQYVWGGRR